MHLAVRAANAGPGTNFMPAGKVFLDANILVYAQDKDSPKKQRRICTGVELVKMPRAPAKPVVGPMRMPCGLTP